MDKISGYEPENGGSIPSEHTIVNLDNGSVNGYSILGFQPNGVNFMLR